MNWTELLKSEMDEAYRAVEGLMDLVDEDKLDWQPESGENWMPTRTLSKSYSAPNAIAAPICCCRIVREPVRFSSPK